MRRCSRSRQGLWGTGGTVRPRRAGGTSATALSKWRWAPPPRRRKRRCSRRDLCGSADIVTSRIGEDRFQERSVVELPSSPAAAARSVELGQRETPPWSDAASCSAGNQESLQCTAYFFSFSQM